MSERYTVLVHVGWRLGVALLLVGLIFALRPDDNIAPNAPDNFNTLPDDNTSVSTPAVSEAYNQGLRLVRLFAEVGAVGEWDAASLATYQTWLSRSDHPERLAFYAPSTATTDNTLTALIERGQTAQRQRDWDTARMVWQSVLERQAQQPDALLSLAVLTLPTPEAKTYLGELVGQDTPYQPLAASLSGVIEVGGYAWRDVGLRLFEREQFALADYAFSQQIMVDNLDAFSYAYRGYARTLNDQPAEGLSDLEQALALDPAQPITYYLLGLHYRHTDAYTASTSALLNAHLLDPANPALAAEIAAGHQLNDTYPLAEEWFITATTLAPDDLRFQRLLAAFYADSAYNLAPTGREYVETLAAAHPEDAEVIASLGRVLYQLAEYDAAEDALTEALALDAENPRSRFYFAELLAARGDTARAVEYYSRLVLSEHPYREQAEAALRRLTR